MADDRSDGQIPRSEFLQEISLGLAQRVPRRRPVSPGQAIATPTNKRPADIQAATAALGVS